MQFFTLCSVTLTILSAVDARPHAHNHRLAHLHRRAPDIRNGNWQGAYTHMVTETAIAMVTVTVDGNSPTVVPEIVTTSAPAHVNSPAPSPDAPVVLSSSSSSTAAPYVAPSPLSVVAAQVSAASSQSVPAASSSTTSSVISSVTTSAVYSTGSGSTPASSGSESKTTSASICGSWASGEPIIHFHNPTNEEALYLYQTNLKSSAPESPILKFGTSDTFTVPPNTVMSWCPGSHWAGAIGHRGLNNGTRHEFNFEASSTTWYNSDLEYGISDSSLKPDIEGDFLDDAKTISAMVGTMDYLKTLNKAWAEYDGSIPALGLSASKADLLSSKYLEGTESELTSVTTNENIRDSIHVAGFLQANLAAYVVHGSWKGVDETLADSLANKQVRLITENQAFHVHSK